jgi:VIT1/CCC1 family predicted Fe2+/Mn2+ transporter
MMVGAIGCNLAWGVVDAVMYVIGAVSSRRRDLVLCRDLGASATPAAARVVIAEALPHAVVDALDNESLDRLRQRLAGPVSGGCGPLLGWRDFAAAAAVCALVLLSTFPVVVPFALVRNPATAIRVSNAVAIVMLFGAGWSLAKFSGGRPWAMGAVMVAIGTGLVAMTIALGG